MKKTWISFILCMTLSTLLTLLVSCKNSRFDVPGKPSEKIAIDRFDREFMTDAKDVDSSFLNLYALKILEVGEPGSSLYNEFYDIFHTDPQVIKLYEDCQKEFADVSDIEENLTVAFYRLCYFFPGIKIPKIYMHISFYGESIISSTGILSASIDKYLGKDYPSYRTLFQPYQTQRMYREKLTSDYMTGWVKSEFTEEQLLNQERLLDYLIYEGKILFLLKNIMPFENMESLTGFDEKQLKWCAMNESKMWESVLKLQHLYTTDRLTISKYMEEAPKTSFFPDLSPGRAIIWNGYKIVESYMKKNEAITIQQLMYNKDARSILAGSSYNP